MDDTATRTIWGSVNKDGTVHSGSGFTVEKKGAGIYTIHFTSKFRGPPAVVATQNNYRGDGWQSNLDGVAVQTVYTSQFSLVTGNSRGDKEDRGFGFIAIGAA
jgi:hypothetical protein